jgi:hypothetical protein
MLRQSMITYTHNPSTRKDKGRTTSSSRLTWNTQKDPVSKIHTQEKKLIKTMLKLGG